jgi:RNA polymerase primary sigma factor
MRERITMNPNRTLESKPAAQPASLDPITPTKAPQSGGTEPEQSHSHRFVKRAWPRRTRRRSTPAVHDSWVRRLSASDERALAERIKAGDAGAEVELITGNLALVLRAVDDYKECGVPLDDLVQEGNLGLIRAARHFDPSTHAARFATYATYWIRCFIMRALATNGSLIQLSQKSRRLRRRYRREAGELRARGTAPSGEPGSQLPILDEIARDLGVPPRRIERARLTQSEHSIHVRLGDLMLADGPGPDQDLVIDEDRALVHAALRRLSPFEAWVICERFGLGEPTSGRDTQGVSQRCDIEITRPAIPAGPSGATPVHGPPPNNSYYQRSYIEMRQDCGLSVHRIQQVEKTALDKLRGLLGRQITEPT